MDPRLVKAIGWTVLVAWAVSSVLDAALSGYDAPGSGTPWSIHAFMGVLVGTAFGKTLFKRNGD